MKNTDFLSSLFFDNSLTMQDMQKGLTNKNFLITTGHDVFVLRVPNSDCDRIVNRHHETLALEAIRDCHIDVELIYYDEVSGYKVTRYLQDAKTFDEYDNTDRIVRTAKLMKRFHGLHKRIGTAFEPAQRYRQYYRRIQTPQYDLHPYEYLLSDIDSFHNEPLLCHNDWVAGNILFTETEAYLIDYEYAADNDPLFDVMSFITENMINDPEQREAFYRVYFDTMDASIRHQLHIWECFHNMLWCAWAMMMYEQRKEAIYRTIADEKYQALCTCTS